MLYAFALLHRFKRDERGAFLALFAIMSIALVATAGAVVDYVSVDQARNKAQVALDAATLALQPQIYTLTPTELKTKAQALLVERLGNTVTSARVLEATTVVADGKLFLRAELTVPMYFVSLVGISDMTTQVASQATRKKNYLEVAFVLDNSGSMANYSRIDNLRSAATCATKILFYGDCNPPFGATQADNVKVSLVPFTMFVNIGASNKTATWMDQSGVSPISNDNFDNDNNQATPYTGPVNRFALYDSMVNSPWQGCVEARPYPYSVNDTEPVASDPSSLFVPVFAPDEPDSGFSNSYISDTPAACPRAATWVWTQVKTHCDLDGSRRTPRNYDNATCTGTTDSYTLTDSSGTVTHPATQPATVGGHAATSNSTNYSSTYSGGYYTNTKTYTVTYDYTDREKQERLCKYAGATPSSHGDGPNGKCPASSLLPLTSNPTSVTSAISAMNAGGGTNIHQGVIWGFHVLSPTAPFSEAGAYDSGRSKVMIVMTDGENTYYDSSNMNKSSWYQAYGYLWNNDQDNSRTGVNWVTNAANMQTRIDQLTVESCTNAKNAGIEIYTIGLEPPNAATQTMLETCASGIDHAYFPTTSSELNTVFAQIAQKLAALRLVL